MPAVLITGSSRGIGAAAAPFGVELIVPDAAPPGLRRQDFPKQTGKPTPR